MAKIHQTAIVDPKAKLAGSVEVGAYSVIGPDVTIGDGTIIKEHVIITGNTKIGSNNTFFPMSSIGQITQDLKYTGGTCYLEIGNNNTFREFITINSATSAGDRTIVGSNNHILAYCHIAHDCILGNNIIMSNLATLAGHVIIEDYAVVGGMAGIHQFCRIGKMSMVGACTKITMDIVPYTIADGNPATCPGLNIVRLTRLGIAADTIKSLKEIYKIIFRKQLKLSESIDIIKSEYASLSEAQEIITFLEKSERGITR